MESLYQQNPDIYQALIESSTNVCVGYTSIIPLNQKAFETTLQPDFHRINSSDIQVLDFPGFYYMHLSSIVVEPAYRDLSRAYASLSDAFLRNLLELAANDIYIVSLSADAVTVNGHRICHSLGMTEMAQRDGESTLFCGSLLPPKMRLTSKTGMEVIRVYKSAYELFKDVYPQLLEAK